MPFLAGRHDWYSKEVPTRPSAARQHELRHVTVEHACPLPRTWRVGPPMNVVRNHTSTVNVGIRTPAGK